MLPAPSSCASRPPPAGPLLPGCALEAQLAGRLWRGSSLGAATTPVLASGFAALDAELPGGGWPLQAVTELLTPQAGTLEWRLLAPALRGWWQAQAHPQPPSQTPKGRRASAAPPPRPLLLINPPHTPHLPGLQALGLPTAALVWVATTTPAEALWAAEQALQSRIAVLAWLPQARPEQIRRLQVSALGSDAPAFLVRPEHAGQQSSAAPLRLLVKAGEDWALNVRLLKRRGPAHERWLALPAVPSAVAPLLTAARRERAPARPPTERPHALARPVLHA